jgi:sugar phosphate isomerase/epimerase
MKDRPVFINVPYNMVEKNLHRILHLNVGVEIYFENNMLHNINAEDVRELGRKLEAFNIACTVHAPFMDLSPGGYDREVRNITKDKLKKTVQLAGELNAKGVVCHPGYDKWRFDGNETLWLESSIGTWTEVLKEAKEDIPVMVENIFEETPDTLIALLDYFHNKNLWFCFDTGHFNLFSKGSIDTWLLPLQKSIREMHLHDNHGTMDEHLPIGKGTFPFRELKSFIKRLHPIIYTIEPHGESIVEESIKNLKEFLS